jgi:LCP family protein required for cell wall assembly
LFSALILACSSSTLPASGGVGTGDAAATAEILVVPADPNATSTPFLPLDPTARVLTPTPLPTAPWRDFAPPSVPPEIAVPPPVPLLAQPEGQVNFLLLGSDQRPDTGGYRTDTVLLVTLNPALGTASITSFPRDLYLYVPGWTMQRINTVMAHGGFSLMQDTFEYNFGLIPDHYALINFWSFVSVIDSLGGIDVHAAYTLTDHRDQYGDYTVNAGNVHMDGETALWYVRSRYSTSDFDRTRRQQEVLIAIFHRLVSLNGIARAPELYDLYKSNAATDIIFSDLTPHLDLASHLANNPANIHTFAIGASHVTSIRTPVSGAAVLLPDYAAITALLRQALNVP